MTHTLKIIAVALALTLSSAIEAHAADQGSIGSGTGLGTPQSRPTRADCVNSFRDELKWCGNHFANDDILREACAAGAQAVLDDCLSNV